MLNLTAANRDPRQFTAPEVFDAGRKHNPHVAFGRGLHTCVGQHLARAEMRVALRTLLKRLPDIRLDGELRETGPHWRADDACQLPARRLHTREKLMMRAAH